MLIFPHDAMSQAKCLPDRLMLDAVPELDLTMERCNLLSPETVQGNLDPVVLFASPDAIESAVKDVLAKAGQKGHILNLGHGVLVGTPEESVAHVFDLSKQLAYA